MMAFPMADVVLNAGNSSQRSLDALVPDLIFRCNFVFIDILKGICRVDSY